MTDAAAAHTASRPRPLIIGLPPPHATGNGRRAATARRARRPPTPAVLSSPPRAACAPSAARRPRRPAPRGRARRQGHSRIRTGLPRRPPGAGQHERHRAARPLPHPADDRGLLLVQLAQEGHQQPLAPGPQHIVGQRQAGPKLLGVVDHREGVEQHPGRVGGIVPAEAARPVGTRHRAAVVHQQPHREAALQHVRRHRGRPGHRPLEGRVGPGPVEGLPPGVEQHRAAGLVRLLLAADHQLAVLGGGPPVHPPQVVAVAVAARDDIVLTGQGQRPGPAVAVARGLAGEAHRRQRRDLGHHGQGVEGAEGAGQFAHAERIRQPELQRPQRIPSAQVRAHPVGHLPVPARLHPVQYETRPGPQHVGHPVLEHQHPGRYPRHVVDPQEHPGLGHRGHPRGRQPPSARHPVARAVEHHHAHQRQRGQQQPDPQQIRLPQHVRAHRRRHTGGQE